MSDERRVPLPFGLTPRTLLHRLALAVEDRPDLRQAWAPLLFREEQYTAVSLDKFVTLVTSQYSKAQWSKYHNGEATLTRTMRNELRRCVGVKVLPPTVAEAAATASPDAAVWQVGVGPADSVILVTGTEPMTLHVNGAVSVADSAAQTVENAHVTPVTGTRRQRTYCTRPTASEAQNNRRVALGVRWAEIIERGLSALESEVTE